MENLNIIKEQVAKVITYSQNIEEPKVNWLIDNWFKAKSNFITMFGGLIYEGPQITFKLNETDRLKEFYEFCQYIENQYNNKDLNDFIYLNTDGFYENKTKQDFIYNGKKIPKGMKILKALKYFDLPKNAMNDIQSKASQLIQANSITGTLCFSVHPLDYLSISENTYNWASCHSLDGDYRAGNLSYMLDSSTIVCYLRGADNVKLPLFSDDVPWNSKKWRVLLFFSDKQDIIFAGRQYPFTSNDGLNEVRKNLLPFLRLSKLESYCDWTDPVIKSIPDSYGHDYNLREPHMLIRGSIYNLYDEIQEPDKPLHFNDLLHSSFYKPHYIAVNNYPWFGKEISKVHIGADCKCVKCSKKYITETDSFMCNECDFLYGTEINDRFAVCSCCERRVLRESCTEIDDDTIICEDCLKSHCFKCDCCNEYDFEENKVYIEEQDIYVCQKCYSMYYI